MKTIDRFLNGTRQAQRLAKWLCSIGCFAGLVIVAGAGLIRTQAQDSFPLPAINPPGAKTPAAPASPAAQAPKQQPATKEANPNETEIAKQCADLLKMATELKTEVDKTNMDTLSVPVVRKAGEIEQLAHKVRAGSSKN